MKRRSVVSAIVLGALVMLGGAGVAQASQYRYDDACYRKISQKERDLDRAIDHHGFHSRQADHARWELQKVREECSYRR